VTDTTSRHGALAHAVLRLALGVNLLVHGLVRFPKLSGFADALVGAFQDTLLPAGLVRAFALVLPFVEAAVGALLCLGLWLRQTLVVGTLVMVALIFGTALREDWSTLGIQMIYVAVYYLLLRDLHLDRYSLDAKRGNH